MRHPRLITIITIKGIAPLMEILFITLIPPPAIRVEAVKRAIIIAQKSFRPVVGLADPRDVIMPSTNEALSALVTKKMKINSKVTTLSTLDIGK